MKLYILRHEDRTNDCSFFSPLTKIGLENSKKLTKHLKEHKIDLIFSSPFIRTLQTIDPYVTENNLKINIEYGLSEIHNEDIISKKSVGLVLPEYLAEIFNHNPSYESRIKHNEITYPENIIHVKKRIKRVLKKIFNEYYNSEYNIILVTHQSLCCTILNIVNKHQKIDEKIINNYNKGHLALVFDNEWIYKPIN
jgi:2,3-bisphosphoglycerate-dependent phosphoglycerate mutase